jgi:putative heme-binding domain-containing protein
VDDAFIADCGSNLIHRKKVRRDGVGLRAERPGDEQRVEFISSRDTWFRPVQLANAPDGTLYIVDMYREIIEHPWSIPPSLKKHLDLNSGNSRGRIYRIVPDNYKPRKAPRLGNASSAELVQFLAHPNGWHRDTAARLLYERQDRKAVPALEKFLQQSPSSLGRMHALHALDGLNALRADHLVRAFDDVDALVREHAIKLSEKFVRESSGQAAALRARLLALADDPAPTVRYQLAFTLGELQESSRIKALARIVRRDAGDTWIRAAVLSSLAEGLREIFQETVGLIGGKNENGADEKGQVDLQAFMRELLQVIGARNDSNEVAHVLDYVGSTRDPALAFALLHGLGEGLQRAHASLPTARIQPVIDRATQMAGDKSQSPPARVEAIELLGLTSFSQSGALLFSLLDLNQPQTVQLAAIHTLGRFADSKIGPEVAGHWPSLTPRLRDEALTVLLARPERIPALLDAVEAGAIRRADLASPQIDFLTNHRDRDIRARSIKLLTAGKTSTRQEVVTAFQSALALTGDAAKGKKVFVERCASCHRLGGEGFVLGPDLVSVRNAGKDKLLISILDPNREVLPQYLAYEIETKDEESLLGILVNETASSVTLRQSYAKDTVVPRTHIARMQSRGQSMMPEGLESSLQPQDIADLLEFVITAPQ